MGEYVEGGECINSTCSDGKHPEEGTKYLMLQIIDYIFDNQMQAISSASKLSILKMAKLTCIIVWYCY